MRVVIYKEGLAIEFCKFSFGLQSMVKDLLSVLEKKRKINYSQVKKKVVDWEGEKIENRFIQRN